MGKDLITPENFQAFVSFCCDSDTSLDPEYWSSLNPLWGHCAVVSLLAQDIFGGELRRASLAGTDFESAGSHYWNRLPDGTDWDFTSTQFFGDEMTGLPSEPRSRDYVLSYPETRRRYELLKKRFFELFDT